jgi:hypothetical protein
MALTGTELFNMLTAQADILFSVSFFSGIRTVPLLTMELTYRSYDIISLK